MGVSSIPTIICDSREQLPYSFDPARVRTIRAKLDAGDYSVSGLERAVALERKSLEDFVGTVIKSRDRFFRELERLRTYRAAAVLVEANLTDVLTGNYPSGAHPNSLMGAVMTITVDYSIPVFFCSDRQAACRWATDWLVRQWRVATAEGLVVKDGRVEWQGAEVGRG